MSNNIVQFNEEIIKGQIKELVRGSVEETLNELLEAEAEKLTQAARYERSEARQGYRSGHYDRNLTTTSGDVTLHVPRLKGISFETAIIERYRRQESSVEEALIEMYLAGVSVRRVEDIIEALWGSKVSASTISELNKKAYVNIEAWRNRPLQGGKYPYVYVDGIYLKRNWGGEYENVAILVAIAVNEDGYREVLGAAEGMKEDKASWVSFFQWLRGRGLSGVKLIVGDNGKAVACHLFREEGGNYMSVMYIRDQYGNMQPVKTIRGEKGDPGGFETESEEHPGCYYQTVDGEKEWINPPMVVGEHYRTIERYNGKPVYVVLFNMGKASSLAYGHMLPGFDWTDDDAIYKTVIHAEAWFGWNDGSYIQPYIHPTDLNDDGFIEDSGAGTMMNFDKGNYAAKYLKFANNYFFVKVKYVI